MFVQYSFVQRRPSMPVAGRRPFEPAPGLVMSAGVAFMAMTSALYALAH
jgi:hypothetical protein